MCVYIYVYVYVYVCIYIYIYMYICIVTGDWLKDLANIYVISTKRPGKETWRQRDKETLTQRPIETCQWSECGV